jgi:hypothetical protein
MDMGTSIQQFAPARDDIDVISTLLGLKARRGRAQGTMVG